MDTLGEMKGLVMWFYVICILLGFAQAEWCGDSEDGFSCPRFYSQPAEKYCCETDTYGVMYTCCTKVESVINKNKATFVIIVVVVCLVACAIILGVWYWRRYMSRSSTSTNQEQEIGLTRNPGNVQSTVTVDTRAARARYSPQRAPPPAQDDGHESHSGYTPPPYPSAPPTASGYSGRIPSTKVQEQPGYNPLPMTPPPPYPGFSEPKEAPLPTNPPQEDSRDAAAAPLLHSSAPPHHL